MVQKHHNLKTDQVADFFYIFLSQLLKEKKGEKKEEEKSDFIT